MARFNYTLLILCIAGSAFSYPTPMDFNHRILRWPISLESPEVYYRVHGSFAVLYDYEFLVDQGAELWNDVEGSFIELLYGETETNIDVHLLEDNEDWGFSAGYSEFDGWNSDGDPEHCSIYIKVFFGIDYDYLSKTILHELGHCLGLGHSLIPQAVMSYYLDKTEFALSLDDQAALSRLYPVSDVESQIAPGCADESFAAGFCFLLPLGLSLGARRKHREIDDRDVRGKNSLTN